VWLFIQAVVDPIDSCCFGAVLRSFDAVCQPLSITVITINYFDGVRICVYTSRFAFGRRCTIANALAQARYDQKAMIMMTGTIWTRAASEQEWNWCVYLENGRVFRFASFARRVFERKRHFRLVYRFRLECVFGLHIIQRIGLIRFDSCLQCRLVRFWANHRHPIVLFNPPSSSTLFLCQSGLVRSFPFERFVLLLPLLSLSLSLFLSLLFDSFSTLNS
jgi:hypothetical protein